MIEFKKLAYVKQKTKDNYCKGQTPEDYVNLLLQISDDQPDSNLQILLKDDITFACDLEYPRYDRIHDKYPLDADFKQCFEYSDQKIEICSGNVCNEFTCHSYEALIGCVNGENIELVQGVATVEECQALCSDYGPACIAVEYYVDLGVPA